MAAIHGEPLAKRVRFIDAVDGLLTEGRRQWLGALPGQPRQGRDDPAHAPWDERRQHGR